MTLCRYAEGRPFRPGDADPSDTGPAHSQPRYEGGARQLPRRKPVGGRLLNRRGDRRPKNVSAPVILCCFSLSAISHQICSYVFALQSKIVDLILEI